MSKHPPTTEHNYLAKLRALLAEAPASRVPENVTHILVQHDPWCNAMRDDRAFCNCDPVVSRKAGVSYGAN